MRGRRRRAPEDAPPGGEGVATYAHVSFHSMAPGQAAAVHVGELVEALDRAGIRAVAVNRGRDGYPRLLAYAAVLLRALRELSRVDVLYVRAHPVALPLMIAARCRRVPTIVEVNGTPADMTDAYPWLRVVAGLVAVADRTLLRLADGITAVSPGLRDWVRAQGAAAPVAVVPNAADSRRFHPAVAPRAGLPRRYVAYCGALAPWQGLDTLVEATTHPRWPRDVRLVVAGAGPLRGQLRAAEAAGAPIDDIGLLAHDEVAPVMTGALAIVSPRSHREASPMKLYEALACGVPVVASAVPGQVEVVESRSCGLTFTPGDAAELAAAVAALAEHPDLRTRLAVSARGVGEESSWDARAATLLDFVRTVVEGTADTGEGGRRAG